MLFLGLAIAADPDPVPLSAGAAAGGAGAAVGLAVGAMPLVGAPLCGAVVCGGIACVSAAWAWELVEPPAGVDPAIWLTARRRWTVMGGAGAVAGVGLAVVGWRALADPPLAQ